MAKVGAASQPRPRRLRGHKELLKGRISQKNPFYLITTCCYHQQKKFTKNKYILPLVNSLHWLQGKGYFDLHFYIVMPDHLHTVFQLIGNRSYKISPKTRWIIQTPSHLPPKADIGFNGRYLK